MIDIHTHILPDVDDGSNSLEMSRNMLKNAIDQGITHIILTPHEYLHSSIYYSKNELQAKFQAFQQQIMDLPIKVYLGGEIYYTEKALKMLYQNDFLTFHDSSYILIEFPMHVEVDIDEILFNIRYKGFKPILAHPERYSYLNYNQIASIKDHSLIQINAASILGLHGKDIKKRALGLLKRKLVDFVASDSHNINSRPVNLKEAYDDVAKKFSKEYAEEIFTNNQMKLIKEIDLTQ
ncbi:MAG: hypothetical protein PHP41_03105 [Bacilli bacterium]|nr:hypothetical protein [Bacilli bacterium]